MGDKGARIVLPIGCAGVPHPRRGLRSFAVAATWAVAWVACDDRPGAVAPLDIRDVDADALPLLRAIEEARMGSVSDPDTGLTAVTSVTVDSSGRVFVFDKAGHDIRAYARDGTYLYSFGRKGDGPGEFSDRSNQEIGVRGDKLWVFEVARRRWTLFTLDGRLETTGRLNPIPLPVGRRVALWEGLNRPIRQPVLAHIPLEPWGGGFISRLEWTHNVPPGLSEYGPGDTVTIPRLVLGANGEVLDTVGWERHVLPAPVKVREKAIDGFKFYVPVPPSDRPLSLQTVDGRWVVHRSVADTELARFRVIKLDLEGDTVLWRDYHYAAMPYEEEELRGIATVAPGQLHLGDGAVLAAHAGPGERPDPDRVADVMLDEMDFPKYRPPVLDARANPDGSLWLRRPERQGGETTWLVVDATGDAIGRIEIPEHVRLLWASSNSFLGLARDSLRIPWVVRYRLQE